MPQHNCLESRCTLHAAVNVVDMCWSFVPLIWQIPHHPFLSTFSKKIYFPFYHRCTWLHFHYSAQKFWTAHIHLFLTGCSQVMDWFPFAVENRRRNPTYNAEAEICKAAWEIWMPLSLEICYAALENLSHDSKWKITKFRPHKETTWIEYQHIGHISDLLNTMFSFLPVLALYCFHFFLSLPFTVNVCTISSNLWILLWNQKTGSHNLCPKLACDLTQQCYKKTINPHILLVTLIR